MPIDQNQINARVAAGKPFIVAKYMALSFKELMCKVDKNPNVKEMRIILKHTLFNKNGAHVYQEFLPSKTVLEMDKAGQPVAAKLPDGTERKQLYKEGTEVLVDLDGYARDGGGFDIRGPLTVL